MSEDVINQLEITDQSQWRLAKQLLGQIGQALDEFDRGLLKPEDYLDRLFIELYDANTKFEQSVLWADED